MIYAGVMFSHTFHMGDQDGVDHVRVERWPTYLWLDADALDYLELTETYDPPSGVLLAAVENGWARYRRSAAQRYLGTWAAPSRRQLRFDLVACEIDAPA